MTFLLNAVGVVLVGTALHDIFNTIWRPKGFGGLTKALCLAAWKLTRLRGGRLRRSTELAGPLGLLLTVLAWATLIVVGFALVYWPHLPEAFHHNPGLTPQEEAGLLTAIYLSLTALTTLGLGDIVPAEAGMRMVVPFEALVGFVLLSASISWVLQVYPALLRRRTLARRLGLLAATDTDRVVREGPTHASSQILNDVTAGITTSQVDLLLYGECYYFRESEPTQSLAYVLPYVLRLTSAAEHSSAPEVRHAGSVLRRATDDLAVTLDSLFLKVEGADTATVLEAYRVDHQQPRQPQA
jgi:hypothetical protein